MQLKLWHIALALVTIGPVHGGTILTTLNLVTPVTNVAGANRIEYLWTTPLSSGSVIPTNVTNLTMSMFNGNTLVYTDTVLAGGVMQPFGGVSRVASDLQRRFNLNTMTLL